MDPLFLTKTPLFQGIAPKELEQMLECLGASARQYGKGQTIYHVGETVEQMGVVVTGSVHVVQDDVWGNRSIWAQVGPGQVFAETYASLPGEVLNVGVEAVEETQVLFLDVGRVLQVCPGGCPFHSRLLRNLLQVMALKNLNLTRKISHITPRSIRERMLAYLSNEAVRQGTMDFRIPFNRQQLADYLSVDRSALSAELSKMKREGLLDYQKNHFMLHGVEAPRP
ncbi:MAG TPA: Crp/Fnr family transcriptional regulator [Firmicutes bacterium]|nr:Crp/Fnr family transcriptional regulator [Bacillota bacterium]